MKDTETQISPSEALYLGHLAQKQTVYPIDMARALAAELVDAGLLRVEDSAVISDREHASEMSAHALLFMESLLGEDYLAAHLQAELFPPDSLAEKGLVTRLSGWRSGMRQALGSPPYTITESGEQALIMLAALEAHFQAPQAGDHPMRYAFPNLPHLDQSELDQTVSALVQPLADFRADLAEIQAYYIAAHPID